MIIARMKKTLFFLSATLLLCTATDAYGATAIGKLSPYTQHFMRLNQKGLIDENGMMRLPDAAQSHVTAKDATDGTTTTSIQQKRLFTRMENIGGTRMVESFMRLADGASTADIEAAGVEVTNEIGGILIVKIPADSIEQIAELESVDYIEISQPLRLLNNVTREITHTDFLHAGSNGLDQAYTGKDVIVGIIDSGIEFNHINFKDDKDSTRIVRAYVGSSNPYGGSGITYTKPEQIERLTTDTYTSTHGTHTTGTAAGSYTANGFQGMAPDADLYLCGLPNLTTTEMVGQAEAIVSYAKEVGKPVVINLSVGGNNGPHMGSDETSIAFDELAGEGVIFVIASGNEGTDNLYLNKTFENATGEEQCRTIVETSASNYGSLMYYGVADGYTRNPVSIKLLVIDTQNNNEVMCESEVISESELDEYGMWMLSGSENATQFKNYFSFDGYYSDLAITLEYDESIERYVTYMQASMTLTNRNRDCRYKLGLALYGTQGDEINMWTDSSMTFTDNGSEEYTAGSSDGSINEIATGREAISVGANVTEKTWRDVITGLEMQFPNDAETIGNMATFSSYGYDMNGVWHPTIVAPGHAISSSFNSYNSNYQYGYNESSRMFTDKVTDDEGNTYYWMVNSGTSMATPAVTGIIATWLQYDPTLTPDDIKDIFAHTAQKPENYGTGKALQWGPNGIIDAYAGLAYMGAVGVNDVTKEQDMVLVYPNPTNGQFKVFAQSEEQVELNIYSTGGTKVFGRTYTTDGSGNFNVDLRDSLPAGIYVLQLRGDRQNYSTKLVIKD